MPKISVITATFNACDGLRQTVASVRGQTFADIEHVVVDGGSTDGTVQFLQSLGSSVTWVSEPDDGIADAMNKGIEMSRGEFIVFLHSEDTFYDASVLADVVDTGLYHDLISCRVALVTAGCVEYVLSAKPMGWLTEFKMTSPHQGLLVKSSLFDQIGRFDKSFRIAMDYDFLVRAKRAGAGLRTSPIVLARMPATGVSTRMDWVSVRDRLREDRRLQRNGASVLLRAIKAIFWPAYFLFKWLRHRGTVR